MVWTEGLTWSGRPFGGKALYLPSKGRLLGAWTGGDKPRPYGVMRLQRGVEGVVGTFMGVGATGLGYGMPEAGGFRQV